MARSFSNPRALPPHAVQHALDFGLKTGEQRTHRLRVQLRHKTTLLRQGRQGMAELRITN